MHYQRWRKNGSTDPTQIRGDIVARFFSNVEQAGDCWIWTGRTTKGYGLFKISSREGMVAHKWAYQYMVIEVPPGLELDHYVCRDGLCVNPYHLDPVTPAVNNQRTMPFRAVKTHCKHGHRFTEETTGRDKNGHRYCKACNRGWRESPPPRPVKTHCKRGHPFSEQNTGRDVRGHRYCKTCARGRGRRSARPSRRDSSAN